MHNLSRTLVVRKMLVATIFMLQLVLAASAQDSHVETFLYNGSTKCITLCDDSGHAIDGSENIRLDKMHSKALQDILELWDTSLLSKSFIIEFSVLDKEIKGWEFSKLHKYKLQPVDNIIGVNSFPRKAKTRFLSKYKAPITIIYKSDNDNMYAISIPIFISNVIEDDVSLDMFFEE